MEKPKKRTGRPRKGALQKQQQFSISLEPLTKLALEIMARDRGESLSQTVEHAVLQAARTYKFDGGYLMADIAQAVSAGMEALGIDKSRDSVEDIGKAMDFLLSPAGKALLIPDQLKTDTERYFLAVLIGIKERGNLPMDDLFNICQEAHGSGIPKEILISRLDDFIKTRAKE